MKIFNESRAGGFCFLIKHTHKPKKSNFKRGFPKLPCGRFAPSLYTYREHMQAGTAGAADQRTEVECRSSKEAWGDEGRQQGEEEPRPRLEEVSFSLPLLASLRTLSNFNWELTATTACGPDSSSDRHTLGGRKCENRGQH